MPRRYALAKLLLTPSLLSGLLLTGGAMVLLGYEAWRYIVDHQAFYGYLVGPDSFGAFVGQASRPSLAAWLEFLADAQLTYYLLLLVLAGAVGLATYTVLQISGVIITGSVELLHATLDRQPAHRTVRLALLQRLGLRCLALAGWAVYTAAFLSVLLPFGLLLGRLGLADLHDGRLLIGAAVYLAAGVWLVLASHLHVVFMRLVALRPRVFGGTNEIIEAEG